MFQVTHSPALEKGRVGNQGRNVEAGTLLTGLFLMACFLYFLCILCSYPLRNYLHPEYSDVFVVHLQLCPSGKFLTTWQAGPRV